VSRPRPALRHALRLGTVLSVAATATVLGAGPAFAHVTAQPGDAAQGGYSVVSLRVPNESDTAGTGLLVGALGLGVGAGAVLRSRRTAPAAAPAPVTIPDREHSGAAR
jgi:hypothetical protein